jgi:hypothetical protein
LISNHWLAAPPRREFAVVPVDDSVFRRED